MHARNEDAFALGRRDGVGLAAVVCDGVSSSRTPERAARAAADATLQALLAGRDMLEAVEAAVRAVAELSTGELDDPACTLLAALVPENGSEITVAWIGDSRAYWLATPDAPEPSRKLTLDHSWAAELSPPDIDEAALLADPRAHVLTRWLGPVDREPPEPDATRLPQRGPGALLLCSDGLWNYLPEPAGLAELALAPGDPADRAAALTGYALECGGRDNITVVLIPIG